MRLAGAQLDRFNFKKDYHQGIQALQGVSTVLPFFLNGEPISDEAIWVFLSGRIAVNGRDFSVDIPGRTITWLAAAPYGISTSDWLEIDYFTE